MARTFQFHVSGRRVLLGLLLTVVPISLLALYTSTDAGQRAESRVGERLQATAESTAAHVQDRIRAKVVETALMAADSAVLTAVAESNRQYDRLNETQILARLEDLDQRWNTPAGQQTAERMLANPASRSLRRKLVLAPAFLRITVTDRKGGTIAATHKTLDYYQADEEYWQDIFVTGRGAISLTDVLYDDAMHSHYIGVGVPVVNDDNTLIGTLDALVDVSSLFPLVHRTDLGLGGTMALVKSDGAVIASSAEVSLADREKSVEFSAILDAASRFQGRRSGFMMASFPQHRDAVVAFADTGLSSEFRNLDWLVVASQNAPEVLGASSTTQILIMGIALLSLASVVFVAVYFSLHRQSEIEEIEEDMRGHRADVAQPASDGT